MDAWIPPDPRYYYEWYGEPMDPAGRSDLDIKQEVLDRVRSSAYENQLDIDVDIEKHDPHRDGQDNDRKESRRRRRLGIPPVWST